MLVGVVLEGELAVLGREGKGEGEGGGRGEGQGERGTGRKAGRKAGREAGKAGTPRSLLQIKPLPDSPAH